MIKCLGFFCKNVFTTVRLQYRYKEGEDRKKGGRILQR